MKNFLPVICNARLFAGVSPEETSTMLNCLSAVQQSFAKGQTILHAGDPVAALGLVLEGRVLVVKDDFWGSRNIMASIGPGQCFAETFACVPGALLGVTVAAETACTVLFLDVQRILSLCPQSCGHHALLVRNLLAIIAQKNLAFNEKLTHVGQRSTRAKLLSYLSAESQRCGSREFDIPFTRQQLADYLFVERSGLSQELCRMRDEGLLEFRRNHFVLKQHHHAFEAPV